MKKAFTIVASLLFSMLFTYAVSAYDTSNSAVPATGDTTYILIIAAAAALAVTIFLIIWRSKKNNSDDE